MPKTPKFITPNQWSKKDLLDAWRETVAMKEKLVTERDQLRRQLEAVRADHSRDVQALQGKIADVGARANREQGRADAAEAALKRAHEAFVLLTHRLLGR